MKERKKRMHGWLLFAGEMLCVFLVLYIIQSVFFSWALVHGDSMNPTVKDKDVVIVSKMKKIYQRGDIVICHSGKGVEGELIKRVIGVPGDVIEIEGDTHRVLVNDKALEETYLMEETWELGDISYPARVPPGQYFVMGDNRNDSLDSRFSVIGTLPAENIEGRVQVRIFPFTRMKWFD